MSRPLMIWCESCQAHVSPHFHNHAFSGWPYGLVLLVGVIVLAWVLL